MTTLEPDRPAAEDRFLGCIPDGENPVLIRRRIGHELRTLRRKSRMSLEVAARASGLSRSFISMVENGTSEIAVSRLIRLANVYGVLVADLFAGVQATTGPEFIPAGGGHHVPKSPPDAQVDYLASASWPLQPFHVALGPGVQLESLQHPGSEFIHCIEGNPTLIVDGERFAMSPGDTLVIPDHAEHTYHNGGTTQARLLGGVERSPDWPRDR
ncbi:MAG: helix-turn-helix domain-containing protein [Streptosporangiaceae bacterium]